MIITDTSLLDTVLAEVKTLNVKQSQHSNNSICRPDDESLDFSYYNEELFSWINKGLAEVTQLHYSDTIEIKITECWATKTGKFQKHHPHTHPNSIISGIIYLTDNPGANTQFYLPNPWHWVNSFLRIGKDGMGVNTAEISPVVGKVIFFPGNLKHDTLPNLTSTTRYTISFNTFMSGTIAKAGTPGSVLKINHVSVEDVYKNNKS
jgi:uncharacterized protein (TIGR02466 family)